jgi:CubicO group peptidase (beta-lactamase class C family)/peptidoglycan/LPS O-acetylase OafA/YrhL
MARSPAVGSADQGRSGRAAGPASPAAPARETFLDVVRAVAIVRVVAWHTFGVAAITYVVAAIPAMFFVTGSLLAKSFGRRSVRIVLADRFRRLLVPLWGFGLVAWVAMAVAAAHTGTGLPLHRALVWVFPLADPAGTGWEGGWLSSHLWYVRTVVWLLLAGPLLLRAVRARPRLTFAVLVAAVFALDLLARSSTVIAVGHRVVWGAGDLALYAVFLVAGFLHRDGALRQVTRRGWLVVAVVAGLAAAGWRLTQPVPLGVVNNSHPLHLFVGTGWLALALALQQPLARLGTRPVAGRLVRAIGARSLTIYLWHTAAIILAANVLDATGIDGATAHPVALAVLTVAGILIAVHLFGWIEDLAARRAPRGTRPPLRVLSRPALALATAAAVTGVVVVAPSTGPEGLPEAAASVRSARRPPVPSRPPPPPTFAASPANEPAPADVELSAPAERRLVARLDGVLQAWAERTGVAGALVGVAGPTLLWQGATGARPDTGSPLGVADRIELASLTKLFTATAVHRLADQNRIDLAAPLPELRSLPSFPYELEITVEQLLRHTSGLVNYLDTYQYTVAPDSIDSPEAAVMASVRHPLAHDPGADYLYSSTNFLVLGLLVEQVSGRPLTEVFGDELFGPLGMRDTVHRPPTPAWPRGGTAGVDTTLTDLLNAGAGILRGHAGLSAGAYAAMTDVDVRSGFGPGTFGFCPCRLDDAGRPKFFGLGYYGATTMLVYASSVDLIIAVDLAESLGVNGGYAAVETLFEMIEEAALAAS